MSTEKGNAHRTRPQKYKNTFVFKNSLHDTSKKTKLINSLQVVNTCERCKDIIEWKIKYKKYKPLRVPGKCNKCEQKTIKHAYHTICNPCAKERKICPKCGKNFEPLNPQPDEAEEKKLEMEMHELIKSLSERKRRTFLRYMNKQKKQKNCPSDNTDEDKEQDNNIDTNQKECTDAYSRKDMLDKLKSLVIEDEKVSNDSNSDYSDEDSSQFD